MAQKYRAFLQVRLETFTKNGYRTTGTLPDIGAAPENNPIPVFGEQ